LTGGVLSYTPTPHFPIARRRQIGEADWMPDTARQNADEDGTSAARARGRTGPPAAERPAAAPGLHLAGALVAAALLVAALYFGRDILIPLALACLLGFVLNPPVQRLKRWGLPRAAAVSLVLAACLALLAVAAVGLAGQVRALSAEVPVYRDNVERKVRDLRQRWSAPGMLSAALQTIETVKKEVERPADVDNNPATVEPAPPPVLQVEQRPKPWQELQAWFAAAGGPLATAGIVLVFLFLVLLDRQDLRDRMLRLLGGNLHRSTDAMNEAGTRISRYLTMQLAVNLLYGVPMAAGLWLIGVPGAVVWGALAAVMRFMPYVGPLVSAVFPLALAFAVDPGWNLVLWTLALIVALELVSNNVVEPWLYGASTGLSAMSLLVSASFWTVLWGPIGLVMATPLTVCLLVIGRHLPALHFLDVLLGSRPALDLPTRLYQRLLADDAEEAIELAVDTAQAEGVTAFYHRAGVPALRQASDDHEHLATAEHRLRVVAGMEELIDELRDQFPAEGSRGRPQVVCIGAKWEVDALAARMLAHALEHAGHRTEHHAAGIGHAETLAALDLRGARIVCLSQFSAAPQTQARLLCRRLRRRWPALHIVLALWNAPPDWLERADASELGADALVTTVDEAVMHIGRRLRPEVPAVPPGLPVHDGDLERVRALHASGVLGEHLRPRFAAAAQRASDIFDVPLALVSMIDAEVQHLCAAGGTLAGAVRAGGERVARPQAVCTHVVASAESLVVEDAARDPRFADHRILSNHGLRFYAGAPLRDGGGAVLGSLALLDTAPRAFSERELRLLEAMARELMASVLEPAGAGPTAEPPAPAPDAETPSATVGQPVPP
jgi:predicted PurR-regulated permease PerM